MNVLENNTVVIQEIIRPGQKNVEVLIPLKDAANRNSIEHVEPACNCTAKVSWTDDEIVARYTDNTAPSNINQYPTKTRTIRKHLTIYHNDGEPLKVKKLGKGMIFNPKKSKEVVYFEVTVSTNEANFKE